MTDDEDAAKLAEALAKVDDLTRRHWDAKIGTPLLGSPEAADRVKPLGEQAGVVASIKLAVALDHLRTWQELNKARVMPGYAHLSLCRPSFESSAQVRWLLDAEATPEERIGRALGVQLKDYGWRAGFEQTLLDGGHTFSPEYVTAQDRIAELKAEAAASGLAIASVPTTTELVKTMHLFDEATDRMAWQYTSGVFHGQAWASLLGETEVTRPGASINIVEHTADVGLAVSITAGAVHSLSEAIGALETYLTPVGSAS
jgi:hypothetical protein